MGENTSNRTVAGIPWPSSTMAWYAVGVLFVAYTFSFADRIILSLLVEPIKQDLALSDTKISRVTRFRFRHLLYLGGYPYRPLSGST
jgi:hypothetical protein